MLQLLRSDAMTDVVLDVNGESQIYSGRVFYPRVRSYMKKTQNTRNWKKRRAHQKFTRCVDMRGNYSQTVNVLRDTEYYLVSSMMTGDLRNDLQLKNGL